VVGAPPACCVGDEDAAKNGTDDSGADDFKSPASKDDHIGVDRFELGAMATNAAAAGRRKLPPMLDALIFNTQPNLLPYVPSPNISRKNVMSLLRDKKAWRSSEEVYW
jgi:hypothetical protein